MEHSLIIELAACLFCFRWNCVHKEDRWTWCGICMASPRRVWERRILGAKPAGLGSAATEIKLFGNMQLRPGSLPSLSLRHFPSTKGLDFDSAVGAYCIPTVTFEKHISVELSAQFEANVHGCQPSKRGCEKGYHHRQNICHLQQRQQRNINITSN